MLRGGGVWGLGFEGFKCTGLRGLGLVQNLKIDVKPLFWYSGRHGERGEAAF